MILIAFSILTILALGSAAMVVTHRNPVVCALALAFNLISIAGFYLLLDAQFVALLQVIVYAGAIMVLFLFVLMLLNVKSEGDRPGRGGHTLRGVALALVTLLVLQAGAVLARWEPVPAAGFDASTRRMAQVLFSPHFLYVFEATSILILAALVGAVALARKER